MTSEEREKIPVSLATVDEKISTRRNKHDDFLSCRISTVKKRNDVRSGRLMSHRISEQNKMENNFLTAQDKDRNQTVRLRQIYKESFAAWNDWKDTRSMNYQLNLERQGDNSQAIKKRNL